MERLYYRDSYLTRFKARVMAIEARQDNFGVVLDRSAFYPASGGQLHDTGTLAGETVIEAIEADGDIIHVLGRRPRFAVGDEVEGEIDWARRRDNMQKHTGQHILSQAFIRVCDAATVSARLGEEDNTIDLDRDTVSDRDIERAEELANAIIFDDRPVTVDFHPYDKLEQLPLRKIPERRESQYRIVTIKDFDASACGGTHCISTGSVGIIKITGREKIRSNLRLHFLTGLKALADYRWRFDQIEAISNIFTRHARESLEAVRDLIDENKHLRHQASELKKELLPLMVDRWFEKAIEIGDYKVIGINLAGSDFKDAKETVANIIGQHQVIVLAAVGDRLLVGVADGLSISASDIMKKAIQKYGGKGGGSPQLAQGGGFGAHDLNILIADPSLILKS